MSHYVIKNSYIVTYFHGNVIFYSLECSSAFWEPGLTLKSNEIHKDRGLAFLPSQSKETRKFI